MKHLITGCGGFVGPYLVEALRGDGVELIGVDRHAANLPGVRYHTLDLTDARAIAAVIEQERPDTVVHLAATSSVSRSWKEPAATFLNNATIFLNLLEAVRGHVPRCRVLSVGSAEVYAPSSTDLAESSLLQATNPYAAARIAQEQLGHVYTHGYSLDLVAARSFNHIGPGQTDQFVVSSLAKKFAELAKGKRELVEVGTTSVVRDFSDVRDVVTAYAALLRDGKTGETYNVCSGRAVSVAEIIETFREISGRDAQVVTDPALVRPVDNPRMVGDHTKLVAATKWSPRFALRETLQAIYSDWLARV